MRLDRHASAARASRESKIICPLDKASAVSFLRLLLLLGLIFFVASLPQGSADATNGLDQRLGLGPDGHGVHHDAVRRDGGTACAVPREVPLFAHVVLLYRWMHPVGRFHVGALPVRESGSDGVDHIELPQSRGRLVADASCGGRQKARPWAYAQRGSILSGEVRRVFAGACRRHCHWARVPSCLLSSRSSCCSFSLPRCC